MTNDNTDRRGRPDSVKVIEVIEIVTIRGQGTNDDPVRKLVQYWSLDGEKLAEYDHVPRVTVPNVVN